MKYYVLDNRKAVPCRDLHTWGKWFETANRHVAQTNIGEARVSTVFLGLDHAFGGDQPMLFETLVFGGPLADEMDRCSTWEQAEEMHAKMCKRVEAANA